MAYSDIKNELITRLNRRDFAADATGLADLFLQDTLKRIQRALNVPGQEKSVLVTISPSTYFNNGATGVGGLIIPSDFLLLKDLTYTTQPSTVNGQTAQIPQVLQRAPLDKVLGAVTYGVTGIVLNYCRQGVTWVLGALPKAGDTVQIDYYAQWLPTVNPTDDNLLLDIADDLVVFGALSYACDHYNDKRGPLFEQRFIQIISDIQEQADRDETAGNAAVGQAFYFPPDHL